LTKETRADRLNALIERERELRKQIAAGGDMTESIDLARIHLDAGLNDLNYAAREITGQVGIAKERIKWLIHQQDVIKAEIKKLQKELGRTTHPGDHR
jgi:hypothetical protein